MIGVLGNIAPVRFKTKRHCLNKTVYSCQASVSARIPYSENQLAKLEAPSLTKGALK
jgi:hypothetical protein